MSTAIRIDTQIRATEVSEYRVIGSKKGKEHWDSYIPDEVVKVTYTVLNTDLELVDPDTYLIPSLVTAKEGDTSITEDGKILVYKNNRWHTWAQATAGGDSQWGSTEW